MSSRTRSLKERTTVELSTMIALQIVRSYFLFINLKEFQALLIFERAFLHSNPINLALGVR